MDPQWVQTGSVLVPMGSTWSIQDNLSGGTYLRIQFLRHFLMITSCSHLNCFFSGHLVTRISIETHIISSTSCSHIYPYFNKHLVKGSLNGIWLSQNTFSSKWVTFFCAKGRPSPRLDSGGAGGECAPAAISRLRRFIAFSRFSRPSQPTKM